MTLVSIYIPTRNRPDFLERALNSVVAQTYQELEVLVCDDGSDVNLDEIKNKFDNKFLKFVWIRNETALGACAARNRLISLAKGDYITGLDDDDEFLPNRIQSFIDHPDLEKFAYLCSSYLINTGKMAYRGSRYSGVIDGHNLKYGNLVGGHVFTRTENLRRISGFDECFPAWQDYDAWYRLTLTVGPGYKVSTASYKVNLDHELGRITTSNNAHLGYKLFIEKHADSLNDVALKSLYLEDKINRREKIRLHEISFGLPLRVYKKVFISFVKKYI